MSEIRDVTTPDAERVPLTTQQLQWIMQDAGFWDDPPCRPPSLYDCKTMAEELIRLRRLACEASNE